MKDLELKMLILISPNSITAPTTGTAKVIAVNSANKMGAKQFGIN